VSVNPLRNLERVCGALSIAAGALHGIVAPAHLEEWWGYGLFFLAAATAQVLFGLALLTNAINPVDFGPKAGRARRGLVLGGIVGNVSILALYVVTRSTGIPIFGPEAGVVEAIGPIDLMAAVLELALVACLARLLRRDAATTADMPP
jgi:hypothetical protein